jgi:hypothetical protein
MHGNRMHGNRISPVAHLAAHLQRLLHLLQLAQTLTRQTLTTHVGRADNGNDDNGNHKLHGRAHVRRT